jgi:hypothetical protein
MTKQRDGLLAMTALRELHPGAPVRWHGRDGLVLNVFETNVDGERIFEVDLGRGVIAIALERDLRPGYLN